MSENPYATDSAEPASVIVRRPVASLGALFGLLLGSWFVSSLITPADPMSTLLATVPVYGLSLCGYFLGIRAAGR